MSVSRIYLDNAATTFPKPPGVVEAIHHYLLHSGAAVGRGAYQSATTVQQQIQRLRTQLARCFHAPGPDHILFTSNGTHSLNQALWGLLKAGDHILISPWEHNSVLRPLAALQERLGVTTTVLPVDAAGHVDPDSIAKHLQPRTRLLVINHASNVTGTLQPITALGQAARAQGLRFLVDAAQSAGSVDIDMSTAAIDLLACPGHKGLLGPLGTGVLALGPDMAAELQPLLYGGTGTHSEEDRQPESLPDKFESGNHNTPGLVGLAAAVEWLTSAAADERHHALQRLLRRLIPALHAIDGVTVWGHQSLFNSQATAEELLVPVVSFQVEGWEPQILSSLLDQVAGIEVRAGLHCAPSAHRLLGTIATGGTVRISPGLFTTDADIDTLLATIQQLAESPLA